MIDLAPYQDPLTIQRVLHTARTIAVVGLSKNELRASYFVGYYLKRHGYRVVPVNPREQEILGETSYPSLRAAQEAVAVKAGALWCQFGVINDEGNRIAADAGLTVIVDRCLKVELARYVGRMHWLGFNTQRITAVRGGIQ